LRGSATITIAEQRKWLELLVFPLLVWVEGNLCLIHLLKIVETIFCSTTRTSCPQRVVNLLLVFVEVPLVDRSFLLVASSISEEAKWLRCRMVMIKQYLIRLENELIFHIFVARVSFEVC